MTKNVCGGLIKLVINTRVLTITSQDAGISGFQSVLSVHYSQSLHNCPCAYTHKHLRDQAMLENSMKSKHNSCLAENPKTHTPCEQVKASDEFLMAQVGQLERESVSPL